MNGRVGRQSLEKDLRMKLGQSLFGASGGIRPEGGIVFANASGKSDEVVL